MGKWAAIARRTRVPLGFAVAALYLWLAKPTLKSICLGVALVIPGLALRAVASGHVQKNEQLTVSGPYAYTRNPLYLGSLILAAGFVVAARSWWIAGVLFVFFLLVYMPVIRAEEDFLRQRFPEFAGYARQVPRWLPRFRAVDQNDQAFSWKLYFKHREYNATLGSLAIIVAIVVKLLWKM